MRAVSVGITEIGMPSVPISALSSMLNLSVSISEGMTSANIRVTDLFFTPSIYEAYNDEFGIPYTDEEGSPNVG